MNDIEKHIEEIARNSDQINDSLWYVDPNEIREALTTYHNTLLDQILRTRPKDRPVTSQYDSVAKQWNAALHAYDEVIRTFTAS